MVSLLALDQCKLVDNLAAQKLRGLFGASGV